jgi:hypothetical protein
MDPIKNSAVTATTTWGPNPLQLPIQACDRAWTYCYTCEEDESSPERHLRDLSHDVVVVLACFHEFGSTGTPRLSEGARSEDLALLDDDMGVVEPSVGIDVLMLSSTRGQSRYHGG